VSKHRPQVDGRSLHVILVADKVKGSNVEAIARIISGFNGLGYGRLYSLIVFGLRAAPIVEAAQSTTEAAQLYVELPVFPGRPEPVQGLVEAWKLARDYDLPGIEPVVILIWTAHVRPRINMKIARTLYASSGLRMATVLARPSPPGWMKYAEPPGGYVSYRSNMNAARLAERLVNMALGLREAAR